MSAFDPFDENLAEIINIPYFFYLVDHPEGRVLFDSGAHPAFITDPRSRLGDAADQWQIEMRPNDDVVSQLATLGVSTSDISHVALSHLHYDHAGGVEFFPEATFYVQREELPFAYWPPVYQRGVYVRKDFDHPVAWKELRGRYDVFGDGSVVLFPTPGHTPGHQSMLVRLDGRPVILIGDAAYLPGKMRDRILPAASLVWSPDAMVHSWEEIEDLERQHDAELLFTHNLHWEGNTKIAPDEWYE